MARIRSLRVLFAEVKKRRPEGYDREGGISEKQAKKEAKRKRKAERKAAKAAKEAEKAGSCFKRKKNDAEDAGAASGEGAPCLLYTSPSPRDRTRSRMPSSA